jgi:hypothetical protein
MVLFPPSRSKEKLSEAPSAACLLRRVTPPHPLTPRYPPNRDLIYKNNCAAIEMAVTPFWRSKFGLFFYAQSIQYLPRK